VERVAELCKSHYVETKKSERTDSGPLKGTMAGGGIGKGFPHVTKGGGSYPSRDGDDGG